MQQRKRQELERQIAEQRRVERAAIERREAECFENRLQAELDVQEDRIRQNHALRMRRVRQHTAEAIARVNATEDCFKAECSTVQLEHRNWCEEDILKAEAKIYAQEADVTMELHDSKTDVRRMRMELQDRKRQKQFEKEMQDLEQEEAVIDNMTSTFEQAFDKEIADLMRLLDARRPAARASADEHRELKRQFNAMSAQLANLRMTMPDLDLTHATDFLETIKGIIE